VKIISKKEIIIYNVRLKIFSVFSLLLFISQKYLLIIRKQGNGRKYSQKQTSAELEYVELEWYKKISVCDYIVRSNFVRLSWGKTTDKLAINWLNFARVGLQLEFAFRIRPIVYRVIVKHGKKPTNFNEWVQMIGSIVFLHFPTLFCAKRFRIIIP